MSPSRGHAWQLIRLGVGKTLSTPYTYIGALAVGGLSLAFAETRWGAMVPFVVPLVVQSLARVLAEFDAFRVRIEGGMDDVA